MTYVFRVASEVEGCDDLGLCMEVITLIDMIECLGAIKQEMKSLCRNYTWSIVKAIINNNAEN